MNRALLLCFGILFFLSEIVIGQTNISGVINTYTRVSSVSSGCTDPCDPSCNSTITLASTAGLAVNDRVLIIQMKGASANTTNTSAHGSITSLNDAGNYEFATIASIAGNTITTTDPLKETYFSGVTPADSAHVQLVRVPVYSGNVNVTGTLTPAAWNGSTGGVLAFETDGNLNLAANISANGMGFRAARRATFAITCGVDTAFYYQSTGYQHTSCTSCGYNYDDPVVRISDLAAYGGCGGGGPSGSPCHTNRMHTNDMRLASFRGEGIVANTFRKTFSNGNVALFDKGRGRWGNGGGGGGNHNAGGGGGSNYGAGGSGGNAYNNTSACPSGTLTNRKGYGGDTLGFSSSKVFMGGGGGEGHDNGGNGSTGTNGGGIIFITAASVTTSGAYSISANGLNNTFVAFGDGSGGGGAGGSVLLNISGSFDNSISVSAIGGNGGNHNNNNCHGTGGGGGGGLITVSGSTAPEGISVNGGANGIQVAPSIDCGDVNWGATSGGSGSVITNNLFNFNICGTILPVKMEQFNAHKEEENVILNWLTSTEIHASEFIVERSTDGKSFTSIGSVKAKNSNKSSYNFTDKEVPFGFKNIYYRLKQIDLNGKYEYFGPVSVRMFDQDPGILGLNPNPTQQYQPISIRYNSISNNDIDVTVVSLLGQVVYQQKIQSTKGINNFDVLTDEIPAGTYIIQVKQQEKSSVQKIIVK